MEIKSKNIPTNGCVNINPEPQDKIGDLQIMLLTVNPFPKKPWFKCVCNARLLKTPWEKEKLLVTSNFSFSNSVFYLFGKLSSISIKFEIVDRNFFQFGRV